MLAQSLSTLNASPGNAAGEATLSQVRTAMLVVKAPVGVQLRWSFAGHPRKPAIGGVAHTHLSNILDAVPVRTTDQDHQRNAPGIYDDGSLGAEPASVRWVGARFLTPGRLGTEEPSMRTRLQSIWSCLRKRVSMAWCNCSRRQQHSSRASAGSNSCRC